MTNDERDALLVRVDERVCHMEKVLTNHLQHHWAVTLMVVGAMVSAVVALLVSLVKGG